MINLQRYRPPATDTTADLSVKPTRLAALARPRQGALRSAQRMVNSLHPTGAQLLESLPPRARVVWEFVE
jgi:hypothetical protein